MLEHNLVQSLKNISQKYGIEMRVLVITEVIFCTRLKIKEISYTLNICRK